MADSPSLAIDPKAKALYREAIERRKLSPEDELKVASAILWMPVESIDDLAWQDLRRIAQTLDLMTDEKLAETLNRGAA